MEQRKDLSGEEMANSTPLNLLSKWETYPPESAPKVISRNVRFIIEHYSPVEPYVINDNIPTPLNLDYLCGYDMEHYHHDVDEPFTYRTYFYGRDHKNLLGFHPELGSICISIRKEILGSDSAPPTSTSSRGVHYQYRAIFRSFERFDKVLKTEQELNIKPKILGRFTTRDILLALFPFCESAKLKEVEDKKLAFDLLSIEEKTVERNFKFGVLLCKDGQRTENDMLCNEKSTPEFETFLNVIGEKVTLKGFKGFRGGLDVKENTTGVESYVSKYHEMNIMFHVSTLLPYDQSNQQQISRKAHIGNDIGIIVFKEASDTPNPFMPTCVVSQFPHFFLVVEKVKTRTESDLYRIACARKDDVPQFGPYPPESPGYFVKGSDMRDFIIMKCINGENASYQSSKFSYLRQRMRRGLLEDLTKSYLRKVSLGSTNSISTWRSQFFGTSENLNRASSSDRDKRKSNQNFTSEYSNDDSNLKHQRSWSFTRKFYDMFVDDKLSPDVLKFDRGSVGKSDELSSTSSNGARTSPRSKTLTLDNLGYDRIEPKTTFFDQNFTQDSDQKAELKKETTEKAPLDEESRLKSEIAILKQKLDQKYLEDSKTLMVQNDYLQREIETKEIRIKLEKCIKFIESIRSNANSILKDINGMNSGNESSS